MKEKEEINQLCEKCAKKQGKKLPIGHCATFWEDTCDVCKKHKMVADWHDYGYNTDF